MRYGSGQLQPEGRREECEAVLEEEADNGSIDAVTNSPLAGAGMRARKRRKVALDRTVGEVVWSGASSLVMFGVEQRRPETGVVTGQGGVEAVSLLLAGRWASAARARWGIGGMTTIPGHPPLLLPSMYKFSFPRCCFFQQTGKALRLKQVPYNLPVSCPEPGPASKGRVGQHFPSTTQIPPSTCSGPHHKSVLFCQ